MVGDLGATPSRSCCVHQVYERGGGVAGADEGERNCDGNCLSYCSNRRNVISKMGSAHVLME